MCVGVKQPATIFDGASPLGQMRRFHSTEKNRLPDRPYLSRIVTVFTLAWSGFGQCDKTSLINRLSQGNHSIHRSSSGKQDGWPVFRKKQRDRLHVGNEDRFEASGSMNSGAGDRYVIGAFVFDNDAA